MDIRINSPVTYRALGPIFSDPYRPKVPFLKILISRKPKNDGRTPISHLFRVENHQKQGFVEIFISDRSTFPSLRYRPERRSRWSIPTENPGQYPPPPPGL